ncbi:MAG: hypothetical protein C0404_12885 [Verrucomicrobia bacterium]|nr:hypothetical protein [Verrucomicrobiota bacterium]
MNGRFLVRGNGVLTLLVLGWTLAACSGLAAGLDPEKEVRVRLEKAGIDYHLSTNGPSGYWLRVKGSNLTDLAIIKGLPYDTLIIDNAPVSDLSPISDLKLSRLDLDTASVSNLSPVRGMSLTRLDLGTSRVQDLSPLKGMPIRWLRLDSSVRDLSPLQGMPLRQLYFYIDSITNGLEVLKSIPTLEIIISWKPAEFWEWHRRYTALRDLCRKIGLERDRYVPDEKGDGFSRLDLSAWKGIGDLSFLQGRSIGSLQFDPRAVTNGLSVIRSRADVESINGLFPEHFWTEFDANSTSDFWTGEEEPPLVPKGIESDDHMYWRLSALSKEHNLRFPIVHVRPLLSAPLHELSPVSTFCRVYAASGHDLLHSILLHHVLVFGHDSSSYIMSDDNACAFLSEHKKAVASEKEAIRRLQAFLDLRHYGFVRRVPYANEGDPPLTQKDLEIKLEEKLDRWTVRCILRSDLKDILEPSVRYIIEIGRDGKVKVVSTEVVRQPKGGMQ